MSWDRFDICEAFCCLAHDYGLYGIRARLDDMTFRPSPFVSTENLSENAQEIYARYEARAERTGPWDRKLAA